MTTQAPSTPATNAFFYDRGPTLEWYLKHKDLLLALLPAAQPVSTVQGKFTIVQEADRADLTCEEIVGAWMKQPETARQRSGLRKVTLIPARFYDRDSQPGKIVKTNDPLRAFTPTAFLSEYSDDLKKDGEGYTEISLYTIPVEDPSVAKIITTEVLLHGSGHNLTDQLRFEVGEALLRFPDGSLWETQDVDRKVRELECKHGPFSHYSGTYWQNGKFPERGVKLRQATDEALCEYVSAVLMGFVYCEDRDGLQPFAGREEIEEFVKGFLSAERVERTLEVR